MSPVLRWAIHGLFCVSGATALIYQVTWARDLALVFGSGHEATSIVLAAFMGGLSLGAFAAGRLIGRLRSGLRAYGLIEIGIAACALGLPAALRAVDALYIGLARSAQWPDPALATLRAVLALVVLVPPTALMGATLPLVFAAVVRFAATEAGVGRGIAWLYGTNTLGAVLGALTAGFVLVPAVGVWRAQCAAAVLNAAVGCAALHADRRLARTPRTAPPPMTNRASGPVDPARRYTLTLAYRAALVSGFGALALEVLWTRGLSISVGTTTYSFTVMLVAFLTGIWLGSWLHAAVPLRRLRVETQMAIVLAGIGLTSFVASAWLPRIPDLVISLNVALYGATPRIRPGTTLLVGFGFMLAPSLLMGIAFPLAAEARSRLVSSLGRAAGDTLGWNTLGSIAGALLAGFWIVPAIGLGRGMVTISALYLGYGAVVFTAARTGGRRLPAAAVGLAACGALALAARIPVWDLRSLGAFQNNHVLAYLDEAGSGDVDRRLRDSVVLEYREGRNATVSVLEEAGYRALVVNGKAVASDNPDDMQHELLLGHAPALVHEDPRSALVIGLGTGVTLGALASHSSIERIVLVEIERAVVLAETWFEEVNGAPLRDPRLESFLGDGRHYLETTREHFDLITADPIHPWNQGSSYLFTREYYAIAKARLAPGGVMCQWIPVYGLSAASYRSILATFAEAFPHTWLWQTAFDTVLVGSEHPVALDGERLAARLSAPAVRDSLSAIGLDSAAAFAAEISMDPAAVRGHAAGGVINTDDNLYIEFAAPLDIGTDETLPGALAIDAHRALLPVDEDGWQLGSEARRERLRAFRRAKSALLRAEIEAPSLGAFLHTLERVTRAVPDYRPAAHQQSRQLERRAVGELALGHPQLAVGSAESAVAAWPANPYAHRTLGAARLALGHAEEAVAHLERSLGLRPNRWRTTALLAEAYAASGSHERARRALTAAIAIHPEPSRLRARLDQLDP